MKNCSKCRKAKPFADFYKSSARKSGLSSWCKGCEAEKARARRVTRDMVRTATSKECPRCNVLKVFSEFYKSNSQLDGRYCYCKVCQRLAGAKSYAANREKVASRVAKRKEQDPAFLVKLRVLGLLRKALDRRAIGCPVRSVSGAFWGAVGYSSAQLAAHLEKQFLQGMTWENRRLWHVDHILPVKDFVYESFDCPEFRACWGLPNLRPIWAKDNLRKGGKTLFLL